jgi:predicted nucleotidyltransferase
VTNHAQTKLPAMRPGGDLVASLFNEIHRVNRVPTQKTIDAETASAIRLFKTRAARRFDVLGALLFGSRARASHRRDSDADVALLLRGDRGPRMDVALELADLAFDVLLETGILVEAIPFWEDEWASPERFANPALIENIRREGVPL